MAIIDEQVRDFENQYKKVLFSKIHSMSSAQTELISLIEDNQKYVGINEELPNIGITLNNKLVELSQQFQEVGLSIFSSKVEDYGPFKLNFVISSTIGIATIFDMIAKVEHSTEILKKYDSELEKKSAKNREQAQLLEKSGPIKKLFLKIRGFLNPSSKIDFSYSQEEKQNLSFLLSEYSNMDDQLWRYTLRDNIIPSLVNYMKSESYTKENVLAILDEDIIPDLKKLGLEDLIPQLKEELNKAYEEKTLNSWDLPPIAKLEMQEAQQQIAQKYSLNSENGKIAASQKTQQEEIKE